MEFDDWFLLITGVLFLVLLYCVLRSCIRQAREEMALTPVVVTSATHTAPGGYPNAMQTVAVYPTTGQGYQQNMYPQQAPYPASGTSMAMPMPMPMPQPQPGQMGMNQQMMPPYPIAGVSMNPPSYDTAVGPHASANPNASQAGYEKQSPYNPSYPTGY